MNDAARLLPLLSTVQARHTESLRTEAHLAEADFKAAIVLLEARGLVAQQDGGWVRVVPDLTEGARRVLTALPENGDTRSGTLVARGLGMRVEAFRHARAELKKFLLVKTGPGRGAGTIGRVPSRGSKYEERVRLLREELRIECEIDVSDAVLEELFAAVSIEPHEGLYPSYGALITEDSDWDDFLDRAARAGYTAIRLPLDLAPSRKFADGMTAFLARDAAATQCHLMVAPVFRGLERDAVELAEQLHATVVQRTRPGVVRLVERDQIGIRENGAWLRKSSSEKLADDVAAAVGGDKRLVVGALLGLCLHVLSPNHVGASIVWFPDREQVAKTGARRVKDIGWAKAFAPPRLNVSTSQHAPLLLHALSQLDRAALVNARGDVEWLGANLNAPPAEEVEGGTRHNSAASYSEAHADAVVFVVSADGPITVFKDGYVIRTTRR